MGVEGGDRFVLETEIQPPPLPNLTPPPGPASLPRSHCLLFLITTIRGGLTGRWKRLYRNNKPWEETVRVGGGGQRRQRRRRAGGRSPGCSQAGTCADRGPWISAGAHFHHLDGSDLHGTRRKEVQSLSSSQRCRNI